VTDVFFRVASRLAGATPPVRQMLAQRLHANGGVTYAPVGGGYALPHPSTRITLGRDSGAVALILLNAELPLPGPRVDDVPVTRLLFFIAPSPRAHLDIIGRLSRFISNGSLGRLLAGGATDEEICQAVDAADAASLEARKPGGKA
jgi:PTS system nitrogen regulatory IIA component